MSIYFVNKDNETVYFGVTHLNSVSQIVMAEASGHEMEKACRLMNRPVPNKNIVYFFGDEAKYLALNW